MMDSVTLSHEQVRDILKAVTGIGNLLKDLAPKSGNQAVLYAVMSNIAAIQTTLAGMARVNSN
jgi:hypothetical protein